MHHRQFFSALSMSFRIAALLVATVNSCAGEKSAFKAASPRHSSLRFINKTNTRILFTAKALNHAAGSAIAATIDDKDSITVPHYAREYIVVYSYTELDSGKQASFILCPAGATPEGYQRVLARLSVDGESVIAEIGSAELSTVAKIPYFIRTGDDSSPVYIYAAPSQGFFILTTL